VVRSVLLATSFPPALGGVETLLYQTSRRLADPPLVVAPIGTRAPDLHIAQVSTPLGARLAYRPLWRAHPSLYYALTFLGRAARAIRAWRPRVLQIGHVYLAPLGWLLGRRFNLPWVMYAYGQEVWRAGQPMGVSALDSRLRGAALRHANVVLSPGSFTSGLLADWSVDPRRVVCVPYGAEPRPPAPPPSGCTLLTVARLIPRKGVDTVLRALAELPPDVTYRVVGRGPDEARLRHLMRTLGVEHRVTFVGRVADLDAEYARASIFVLPARRTSDGALEGYGLVYFEAAAWGRAVIAGRSGGEIDAVVDGKTGLLVDGTSVQQVREAIRALLEDPARRERLGQAGRHRVETTHNWVQAAAVIGRALEDVCGC
jgi:phosphatidyl-myo-inositol dimannoside synthase